MPNGGKLILRPVIPARRARSFLKLFCIRFRTDACLGKFPTHESGARPYVQLPAVACNITSQTEQWTTTNQMSELMAHSIVFSEMQIQLSHAGAQDSCPEAHLALALCTGAPSEV
jgi:hypothetical protein